MTYTERGFRVSKLIIIAAFGIVNLILIINFTGVIPNLVPFFGPTKASLFSYLLYCWLMLLIASFVYPFVWIIILFDVAIPPYIGSVIDRSKAQAQAGDEADPFRQEQG